MNQQKQEPMIPMNSERKQAITALKTARGQVDGIIRMLEEGRYCIEILNPIMAAQALLTRASKLVLSQHRSHCVAEAMDGNMDAEEKVKEIADLMGRIMDL